MRNNYKYYLALIFLLIANKNIFGQYNVPKIIPPAPTAAAFARYTDIPVDPSTGVPSIEIPLYVIKSGKLEIPLSLSYHASGIKVNDISTPVGLGWVLKGMGMVSRTILDRPDEESTIGGHGRALYTSAQAYQDKLASITSYAQSRDFGQELYLDYNYKDKQSDKFNYQLPGKGGGNFRYDFSNDNCLVIPYQPVNIVKGFASYSGTPDIAFFNIKDENGTVYSYEHPYKSTQSNSALNTSITNNAYTSWYISAIMSSDGKDRIEYEYSTTLENQFTMGYFSHSIRSNIMQDNGVVARIQNPNISENNRSSNYITTSEPLLEKIIGDEVIVTFQYVSDRQDWSAAKNRLSSIKILKKTDNTLLREISIDNNSYFGTGNYSYFEFGNYITGDSNLRLKLNGVTLKDNYGVEQGHYSFQYGGGDLPPYNSSERAGKKIFFDEDYWGYFNGANNAGLIPYEFATGHPNTPTWGGNRRPNPSFGKAAMLNRIDYPTGGYSTFEFEQNDASAVYYPGTSADLVGGFRVKSIINFAENSSVKKSYRYDMGKIPHYISSDLFNYNLSYNWDYGTCGYSPGTSVPIPFTNITTSSSFMSMFYSNGSPIVYTDVTEYIGDNGSNLGKKVYSFSLPDDPKPEPFTRFHGENWYDNGSYSPRLLTLTNYKNENGTYSPISRTENTYGLFRDNLFTTGVNVVQTSYEIQLPVGPPQSDPNEQSFQTSQRLYDGYLYGMACPNLPNLYMGYFSYFDNKASEKVYLLTKTSEITYDLSSGLSLTNTTNLSYNNLNHLQPTEKTTVNSKGELLRTELTYPSDYAVAGSNDAYDVMANQRNILTPVIEQRSYKGNQFLSSLKNNYSHWGNGIVALSTVESKKGSNAAETRLRYHSYDEKGNVLSVSKENDKKTSFQYGYDKKYPIAIVENANVKDVFYTGFEESDGNTTSDFKSGKKSRAGGYNYLITNLTDGQYVLSYWQKNGTNWDLQSNTVTVSGGQYTINLPNIQIDELRFCPAQAQMKTFTYDEGIGVTSSNDVNNIITYYNYDGFGRLSVIRDQDNNIKKKIGYNFAGAPAQFFFGVYYNKEKSVLLTKNDCGANYVGGNSWYKVPPGKYTSILSQADADQQAQNDVDLNAQTHVNQNGTCIGAYSNNPQYAIFVKNNCGTGFNGSSHGYTVAAGLFHATSQAVADQLALDELNINGQLNANNVGTCTPSSWPYVKIVYENPHSVYVSNAGGFYNQYYDVVIRFYQDYACTIPLSVNALNVNVTKQVLDANTGQMNSTTETRTITGSYYTFYSNVMYWGFENNLFYEKYFQLDQTNGYNVVY